ncbi:protein FAM156A/FAM156B isoform X3 [Macaca fascicularis]|uniref:protein FAM156A/FAM156B isoform X3 n=1 Tax=Macaca fascicularis TaxID=9541 RepID=UPI003D15BFB0
MAGLLSFYSHERPRSLVREIHLQTELQCSNSNGHSQCVHQLMRDHTTNIARLIFPINEQLILETIVLVGIEGISLVCSLTQKPKTFR